MFLSDDGLNLKKEIVIEMTNDTLTCLEELVRYASDLVSNYPGPYFLFASGGIDSQAMIYAWHLAKIPFTVIHVDYNGMNAHDRGSLVEFCSSLGVPLQIKKFNLIKFLEKKLDRYARKYSCASPQICTHMAFSELVSGTKVFAGNLATGNLQAIDNTIFGLQRYASISKKSIIPFFLMEDIRVTQAALKLVAGMSDDERTNYEFKCELYRLIGIPIIPQADKQTGFEIVKEYYDEFRDRVSSRMKLRHSSLPSKRVFDQLFRNKYLIELNNHYKTDVRIIRGSQ